MSDEARDTVGEYRYNHDPEVATIRFDKGLSEQVVRDISALKNEPEWMTEPGSRPTATVDDRARLGQRIPNNGIDFDAVTYLCGPLKEPSATGTMFQRTSSALTGSASPTPSRSGSRRDRPVRIEAVYHSIEKTWKHKASFS